LILVAADDLNTNFEHNTKIYSHVRVMKVAGKKTELFFDQLIVPKVRKHQMILFISKIFRI